MVPTDGSKYAEKAEDMAISLAKEFQGKVVAVHIMDEKLIYPYEVLEDEGNVILNKVGDKGKDLGVKVEQVLIFGRRYDFGEDLSSWVKKISSGLFSSILSISSRATSSIAVFDRRDNPPL